MNDTLKWVLIGVGAYLLYEQYAAAPAAITASPVAAAPPPAAPAAAALPSATAPSGPTAAQQAAQQRLAILQAMSPNSILAAAGVPSTQLYTASQWNYYLPAFIAQPDLSNYGLSLTTSVPVTTWWNALLSYYTAAANSSTGLGRAGKAKKATPLIPVTYDMDSTGW